MAGSILRSAYLRAPYVFYKAGRYSANANRVSRSWGGLLAAAGLGAAAAFFLDPRSGARRRSLVVQSGVHLAHQARHAAIITAKDMAHRTRGRVLDSYGRVRLRNPADEVIVARVRSKLGRVCSHPHSVEVSCEGGHVILSGSVLKREEARLLREAMHVAGVRAVDNRLNTHRRTAGIPELQGGRALRGPRFELMQRNWMPFPRFVVGSAGAGLCGYGLYRRDALGLAAGLLGAGMFARASFNAPVGRMTGIGAGRQAVQLQHILNVKAPIDEVFAFWSRFEQFPKFMTHVRQVERLADGRFRWRVEGPLGARFTWDASVTDYKPNEVISWKTVGATPVENSGVVRFEPGPDGSTRVNIRLSYNPPAGALGHVIATLFGANPEQQMIDDLLRFKSLIEQGKARGNGVQVRREEIGRQPPSIES